MPLTGELARIDDELRRAYDGDCWHGAPLREILNGVTSATAVEASARSASATATARSAGLVRARFARASAALDWKSACSEGRTTGSGIIIANADYA